MIPQTKIYTNLPAFNAALERRVIQTGKEIGQILREEAVLLGRRLIALTPPGSNAQGRKAIDQDMMNSIRLLEPGDFTKSKRIAKLLAEKNYAKLNEAMEHARSKLRFYSFSSARHKAAQNSRKRVPRYTYNATGDASEWKKHLAKLQSGVGRAKGGWARGVIELGGKSPPSWIRRHTDAGFVFHDLDNEVSPSVEFSNRSGWAGSREGDAQPDAVTNAALRSRTSNMLKRMEREMSENFGRELSKSGKAALEAVA